jgi:hypothetical protein
MMSAGSDTKLFLPKPLKLMRRAVRMGIGCELCSARIAKAVETQVEFLSIEAASYMHFP